MKIFFLVLLIGVVFFGVVSVKDVFREVFFNEAYTGAIAGDVKSQLCLAQLYHIGKFTDVNLVEAEKWYRRAAQNGSQTAMDILCWEFNKCV